MNGFLDSTPYSQLWAPNALSNGYAPPSGSAPRPNPLARRSATKMVPVQVPEQAFKVNTGGDWGAALNGYNAPGPIDARLFKTKNYMVGGAGGGYGAGGGGGSDAIGQFQQKMDQANQANEARYRDILGGYQSRYQRAMDMLNGLGQQEAKDINELYDNQAATQRQSLIGRGLGNSTVLDTMLAGSDRERNADLGRLNDRVRQQALNTDASMTGDTLQFMERRNDQPPDMGLLASLMQSLGQGGGGGVPFGFDTLGGGGGYSPVGSMGGYMPPQYGNTRGDARKAAARAIYSGRNAGTIPERSYQQPSPVTGGYASSWLPTSQEELLAMADAEGVRNAFDAIWGS